MIGPADIVDKLVSEVDGLSREQAAKAFHTVFETIGASLANGGRVQITNFGSFSIQEKDGHEGVNPRTGETVVVPGSKNVRFKAAKQLKDLIND